VTDQQLIQYIVTQEHAGYTQEQIRQALAGQGYSPVDIEMAFKELASAKHDPQVHEYVQQYARQGYPPLQIFSLLTQQGFAAKDVRKAINDVFGPLMPASHAPTYAFLILAIIVAVGGFYLLLREPEQISAPPVGNIPRELSLSEQIARVITIAEERGTDEAVRECTTKLFDEERARCLAAVATYAGDDQLCDQITYPDAHDACLMSFINEDFDSVCGRVKLRENIETCESIKAFKAT
jgi:hypothetical protein